MVWALGRAYSVILRHLAVDSLRVAFTVAVRYRISRPGSTHKRPGLATGLNHGLNRLKFNVFMPLAGINSFLPGLNRFKPVKTTGWHKSI